MGRLLKKAAAAAGRKRKLAESESSIHLKTRRGNSDNGSTDLPFQPSKFVHLLDCGERRESTPLESTPEKNPRRGSASVKMPSEADLEEFFSAAEKSIHQKFINKYNFDIVKDEPLELEGRYEWVEVKININSLS